MTHPPFHTHYLKLIKLTPNECIYQPFFLPVVNLLRNCFSGLGVGLLDVSESYFVLFSCWDTGFDDVELKLNILLCVEPPSGGLTLLPPKKNHLYLYEEIPFENARTYFLGF